MEWNSGGCVGMGGGVTFNVFQNLCTQRASAGVARPSLGTMLRTTIVPKVNESALQPIAVRSAAFPRNNQHLQCWSIKGSALLAVEPASVTARKRLSCTKPICQTTQSRQMGWHHAEETQSSSSQRSAGSGQRRYHSTVCQASRPSMLDSLEEVRSRQ